MLVFDSPIMSILQVIVTFALGIVASFAGTWLYVRLQSYSRGRKSKFIEGDWEFRDIKCGPVVGHAKFFQQGDRIRADVARVRTRDGESVHYQFKYTGRVISNQLLLDFRFEKGEETTVGSLVLRLSWEATSMTGYTTYLRQRSGQVVSRNIFFSRAGLEESKAGASTCRDKESNSTDVTRESDHGHSPHREVP